MQTLNAKKHTIDDLNYKFEPCFSVPIMIEPAWLSSVKTTEPVVIRKNNVVCLSVAKVF